jgi:hypothetical protein
MVQATVAALIMRAATAAGAVMRCAAQRCYASITHHIQLEAVDILVTLVSVMT